MAHEGEGIYRRAAALPREAMSHARPLELQWLLAPFQERSLARRVKALLIAAFFVAMAALCLAPRPVHTRDRCTERTTTEPAASLCFSALATASLGAWAIEAARARQLEPERLEPTWGQLARRGDRWQLRDDEGRALKTMPLWDRPRHLSERRVRAWVHPTLRIAVIEHEQWLERPAPRPPPSPAEIERALDELGASFR